MSKAKISTNASIVALMFIGSATFVGTAALAFEQSRGTDLKKDFRESAASFTLLKMERPRAPGGMVGADSKQK